MMQVNRRQPNTASGQRRGTITMIVVITLVVVLLCIALILDHVWLSTARSEAITCAEACALAAGRALAHDDRLRDLDESDELALAARADAAALSIAAENSVAGQPVALQMEAGDCRYGYRVASPDTGEMIFIETPHQPDSVIVQVHRTRQRANPIALFMKGLTGQPVGDVIAEAEVRLDNHIAGLRPPQRGVVPMLPVSILEGKEDDGRSDTWLEQIDKRNGDDRYGFDSATQTVTERPDGLAEIVLRFNLRSGSSSQPNAALLNLDTDFQPPLFDEQVRVGVREPELAGLGGELNFLSGAIPVPSTPVTDSSIADLFYEIRGQCRIVLLHRSSTDNDGTPVVDVVRPVAGRIMQVQVDQDHMDVTLQPAVITTRTAVLTDASSAASTPELNVNPYIYKLQITR